MRQELNFCKKTGLRTAEENEKKDGERKKGRDCKRKKEKIKRKIFFENATFSPFHSLFPLSVQRKAFKVKNLLRVCF